MSKYEELIKEIATPREYQAWKYRRQKMRRCDIALKMGVSARRVNQLRRQLLRKIVKTFNSRQKP
jgi:DNA-binding CsgD family transcriptional regulator